MRLTAQLSPPAAWSQRAAAFTLAEVVIATAIAAMVIGGIIYGYIGAMQRAEWSAMSQAAQAMAIGGIERTRSARWDLESLPPVCELTNSNFPNYTNALDIPISGTNVLIATNVTRITDVSTAPPIKSVLVVCYWTFPLTKRTFSNVVMSMRTPRNPGN